MLNLTSFGQEELTWSILHPISHKWFDLGKKGSVQEALIETGELPDPFYGMNESKFDWVEDHKWEFKSMFFISEEQLKKDHLELNFPSVDTYAKIYLNGKLILTTENAFIPYTAQIKKLAKTGLNELLIVFTPPVIYHKKEYENASYHLPAPNDVHKIAIAPYTRKPQYQFGWDWSMRMNTIGINKKVLFYAYDISRIINKSTRIVSVSELEAKVEFDIYLIGDQPKELIWKSETYGDEIIKLIEGKYTREVSIPNPELWWPRAQGKQKIYRDKIELLNTDNQLITNHELKFGIKTSELIQEEDEWGTSYYFKVNGRRLFAKGADYIPQDIFPARVKDEDIVSMIETMVESNFNMVRVWGGGYYPDDVFFEKCDELGIMVWQDLMFACAMYPGDKQFECNVKKELNYQIPRISGHPSVVLFNGNNEVEVAWNNWGFQLKHNLYGKKAEEIEKSYDLIFKEVAPNQIEKLNTIPYVHTSPLSNWGKEEYYNHGSQHYWGVWHGKDPLEDFAKKIGRFNAEYGFQSFPEFNTLRSFSEEVEWDLKSDVMKHHQKSYVGNGIILKHAKVLYGEPKTFNEFVYFSQLTQARAVSMAVSGHRIDAPRCGGTLYWQMNDCWPAPSWSSIDYYGNWKALQYTVKKDYEDIAVVAKYEGLNEKEYYLVSDSPIEIYGAIVYELFDLKGKKLCSEGVEYHLKQGESQKIELSEAIEKGLLDSNCIINFEFMEGYNRSFDHLVEDYEVASEEDVVFMIDTISSNDNTSYLRVTNTKFVRNLWISSSEFNVKFDRNFESLLPGSHIFELKHKGMLRTKDIKLMWR